MAVAAAVVVLPAPVVRAQSLSVSPQAGAPGDQLTASGAGFEPVGTITLHIDNPATAPVAGGPVAGDGTINLAFLIPNIPAGSHTLIACRDLAAGNCREQANASFRVVEPPPPPTTTTTTLAVIAPPPTSTSTTTTTLPVIVDPTTTTTTTIPTILTTTTTPVIGTPTTTTTTTPQEALPPGETIPDVYVRGVEVTQGIQDLQSRMPLVAGRRTTVRVHVGADPEFASADGALLVQRPGQPDEVLVPDNGPILTTTDRTDVDGALNFTLQPHHYSAGPATLSTQVWSTSYPVDAEPDSTNNLMTQSVDFHTGQNPTVWLLMLDDGDGPGPPITMDFWQVAAFAVTARAGLLDLHPIADVSFQTYPLVVGPGPEAMIPGSWVLDVHKSSSLCPDQALISLEAAEPFDPCKTGGALRHEPNERTRWIADDSGFYDSNGLVVGRIDPGVPTGGWGGWASKGTTWSKPAGGTVAHEAGHRRPGVKHVNCKGTESGPDLSHPSGMPPVCSLAPIDPDGYFGFTNYHDEVTIYSNDPDHPAAAFPFMGYRSPKWADPYHWCLLLDGYGIPCDPADIGVPPKVDPEVAIPGMDDLTVGTDGTIDATIPNVVVEAPGGMTYDLPIESDEWVVVSGLVDPETGSGSIGQAAMRDGLSAPTAEAFVDGLTAAAPRESSDDLVITLTDAIVYLQLTDADGAVLTAAPLALEGGHDEDQDGAEAFFAPIPWVDGAAALELVVDGEIVSQLPIAPEAPEVFDLAVATDEELTTVTWRAAQFGETDLDFLGRLAELSFTVLWSADGGEGWIPVAVDVPGDELAVPADDNAQVPEVDDEVLVTFAHRIPTSTRLPGGDSVQVRVIASQDVRAGEATSEPFSAPTHPPQVVIVGAPDEPIELHDAVELEAIIDDPEDRGAAAVVWRVRLDGAPEDAVVLPSDTTFSTRDLPVGDHEISVAVADSDGNVATDTVDIEIVERTTPTRYSEEPDPAALDHLRTEMSLGDDEPVEATQPD